MDFTPDNIARMMDFSVVRADHNIEDVTFMAQQARMYNPAAVFTLPAWTATIHDMLKDQPDIATGGVVGFPSGADTTASKAFQAKELIEIGCTELDMVINIGKLRSEMHDDVEKDIAAVVNAAGGNPVKVILECGHLTDQQIRTACKICVNAGAKFVKTGTGWAECAKIDHYISIMHDCVGDSIAIKAAGGVRDLDTLIDLYNRGATRFGVGTSSAVNILEQCK